METDVKVNVIKRNGEEVSFDLLKIANAIKAANQEVAPIYQLNEYQIQAIADNVAAKILSLIHIWNASRPIRLSGTLAVMAIIGMLSINAVAIPVTRFVAPGPLVAKTRPVFPVALELSLIHI